MKTRTLAAAGPLALLLLAGCAGEVTQVKMRDGKGQPRTVDFPKGTVFGDISQEQVHTLARMLADENLATSERLDVLSQMASENAARSDAGARESQATLKKVDEEVARVEAGEKRLETQVQGVGADVGKVDASVQRLDASVQKVDASVQKVAAGTARLEEGQKRLEEAAQKNYDQTRMVIEAFEKVARHQGTGELTVFFPVSSAAIEKGSLEYRRIVEFTDWLAREARGRKLMFVSVGSASATGPKAVNERLAKARSEAPLAVIDRYLVNLPHEYVRIYGTGDLYSPKDVTRKEHERYQHARLIAFYEKGQEPALPEPPQR
jgi:archaellum component FlaC